MLVSNETLDALSSLSNKSTVIVVVKYRYPFFTRLENLEKSENCALIGIFAEEVRSKLFEGYERFFDQVLWFHADYSFVEKAYSDPKTIDVPVIGEIVGQITQVIAPNKIRILECEEVMIDVLCRIRAKYSIPGAKPGDLDYLRDKGILKQECKRLGIPTSRFLVVDFHQRRPVESIIKELEQEIDVYPMFRKPVVGFGSGGGGRVDNPKELKEWLHEMIGQPVTYLIEEYISTREFWANVVLFEDGSWQPMYNVNCGLITTREYLDRSLPIPFIGQRFEECEEEFPGLLEFVSQVIEKLKPLAPHVFCVQGFQMEPKTDKYLFTECGYRLNGARGCGLSYKVSGISQETAFISAYSNPQWRPKPDLTLPVYSVWYPFEKGLLRSHAELPEDAPVKSRVQFYWHVPVCTQLFKANTYNHFVVSVLIEHEDVNVVNTDLDYFLNVWRPDIV